MPESDSGKVQLQGSRFDNDQAAAIMAITVASSRPVRWELCYKIGADLELASAS